LQQQQRRNHAGITDSTSVPAPERG
jgi:hypothetical protein